MRNALKDIIKQFATLDGSIGVTAEVMDGYVIFHVFNFLQNGKSRRLGSVGSFLCLEKTID